MNEDRHPHAARLFFEAAAGTSTQAEQAQADGERLLAARLRVKANRFETAAVALVAQHISS